MSMPVCVCVCLSVREDISGTTCTIFANFLCMLPKAIARSSSGRVTKSQGKGQCWGTTCQTSLVPIIIATWTGLCSSTWRADAWLQSLNESIISHEVGGGQDCTLRAMSDICDCFVLNSGLIPTLSLLRLRCFGATALPMLATPVDLVGHFYNSVSDDMLTSCQISNTCCSR